MDVEEDRSIPFPDRRTVDARQRASRGFDHASGDVTWNDRIRHTGQSSVPEMHVSAADFRGYRPQQRGPRWKIGPRILANVNRLARRRHDSREDAVAHTVYVILEGMLIQTLSAAWLVAAMTMPTVQPTSYSRPTARKHFISVSYDWQYTQSLSFAKHPLADLLGQRVSEVHLETFQYRTADGQTLVNVLEFRHPGNAVGVTVYPFGSSEGATLALRGSIEQLPDVRLAFTGPAPAPVHALTNGRALDAAVGVDMSDRAPGWGLGSHAFLFGGVGRTETDQADGSRYFVEGGGGLTSGPIGVDVSVKFAVNRFDTPVPHRFYTIPVSLRGTLSF
jgi:hypothetical protein